MADLEDDDSIRIIPPNWLEPIDLAAYFEHPERPIELDLGCGKGRFLLARAENQAETNYLGVDRMLRRIRKIDNKARRRNLNNVRLLRIDAYYAVAYLIPDTSISTYYIFFPDPWPKKRHHKYRLMNESFMDAIHRTLTDHGQFHFATDHLPYFDEVMEFLVQDERFKRVESFVPTDEEQTDFELYYKKRTDIGRGSFEKR